MNQVRTALEVIADYEDQCGECPVWDDAASTLYWTDITGRRFYQYREADNYHQILDSTFEVCGFRLNQAGGFTVVNSSGIWKWDAASDPILIASEADGFRCQMNDCTADPAGRLICGSCFYDPGGSYDIGKLIRVDLDGQTAVLDDGFHLANGMGFSPDGQTFYATDSVARLIYAYDYDLVAGTVRNRRVLVKVPAEEGMPDGLTVDAEVFLWSAQWYGSCVVRYDPDGTEERRLATPAKQTSCAAFGGDDLTELYITSAGKSEPMPVMPPAYDPSSGYFGNRLYRVRPGLTGLTALKTKIK